MTSALSSFVDDLRGVQVLVIGDAWLDAYLSGVPGRLSDEAPIPVVGVAQRTFLPGGAANVAANIAALGGRPRLLAVVGGDEDGNRLRHALREHSISGDDLLSEAGRETLTRTRVVAESQLVARFDGGSTSPVGHSVETAVLERIRTMSGAFDAAIVSDHGYGTLTPRIIEALAGLRAGSPRLIVVRTRDVLAYRPANATAFALTSSQAARLAGITVNDGADPAPRLKQAGDRILQATGTDLAAVALDAGALVVERGRPQYQTFTQPVRRGRVTGTLDTFVGALALALGARVGPPEAAELASAATAVAAARDGTAMCSAFELKEFLSSEGKSIRLNRLLSRIDFYRRQGKRIVFTNGCFDILHRGHIEYLSRAKSLGDVLVVGINTDKSVARLKGPGRPIIPLDDRIEILTAFSCVDHIVPFDQDTPVDLIRAIKPHVFVKGGDYTKDQLPEARVVEELGGVVHLLPLVQDRSTTGIIERVRRTATPDGQVRTVPAPATKR
ncbi:MAG TPA: D-glycero-beta-D-manno-heptose 1-phosphate adenylyltransferase [Actinomycetota bacterium]|nr:D-glycero-beta-D-manno-heptose 1-phosphate adenylyltransferase [Actinomycetota bacterium]